MQQIYYAAVTTALLWGGVWVILGAWIDGDRPLRNYVVETVKTDERFRQWLKEFVQEHCR